MKRKFNLMQTLTATIMALFLANCAGDLEEGRGDHIRSEGAGESTNDLNNSTKLNLVLDQIQFEGRVGSDFLFNEHPDIEIHILDAQAENLLACVGTLQKDALDNLGEDRITYANLNAVFVKNEDAVLTDATPVVVRLVVRNSVSYCPDGLQGPGELDAEGRRLTPDTILSHIDMRFGDLMHGQVVFPRVANARFRPDNNDPINLPITAPLADRPLTVDQITLTTFDLSPGESSLAELAVLVYATGEDTPVGCAELFDVDYSGITYGTMGYTLTDADNHELYAERLDSRLTYKLKLVELDNGGCEDVTGENSADVGIAFLGSTGEIRVDDLVGIRHNLSGNRGSVALTTE